MKQILLKASKTVTLFAMAGLPLAIALQPLNANSPQIAIEGADIHPVELGVWEGVVDLEGDEIRLKQLQGDKQIKIAAVLGTSGNVTTTGIAKLYNNLPLLPNGGNNYASLSLRWQITNNTGATLGEATAGNPTGIKLQLMPYAGTTPAADGTFCESGATTLQRPICAISTTILAGKVGASGRNDGTDPVYLAYMTPRDGTNLTVADDTTATESNEATGRTSSTDFARSVWLSNPTLANGSSTTIGLRFRYQQTAAGNGQPRVTGFRYKFRILADRVGGAEPTAGNAYVTTVAGNGTDAFQDGVGASARFNEPSRVAVNPSGMTLYVADDSNHRIRAINLATSQVTTVAGDGTPGFRDGPGSQARFFVPRGVAVNPSGTTLYVADHGNHRIRTINLANSEVTTLAGEGIGSFRNGAGLQAWFSSPNGVAIDPSGTTLYVADGGNFRIRTINLQTSEVTTLAGEGNLGFRDGPAATAWFGLPTGVAIDPSGTTVYVADFGNQRIRAINLQTSQVTTLAGDGNLGFQDGLAATARFRYPIDLAVNPSGTTVYVADFGNFRIRAINLATSEVTTLAGDSNLGFQDGPAATAQFANPYGIAVNPSGTTVYVPDRRFSHRIRQIQTIEGVAP
ncbi:MAG: SMP-30/gluconolactonase/LRE family protein [Cyanosarcina radialis HA8281-LM2]|jgi:DNA-binding beta-propeller fold protein YncE|nr:SMP-30/gluconolactonase/LRE family protein [Cyanosarcina radialis HA8281-LM2]